MDKNKPLLSAIIIAKNEEKDLPGCLESIKEVCDEIVVIVSSESIDKTENIARASGAHVVIRSFDNFADQKQAALEAALGEWVLSIDCDERVSPTLADEIKRAVANPGPLAGFRIPFRVFFLGQQLRFGGMGSEQHLRLFKRSAGRFTGGKLHEGIEISGIIGELSGAMNHTPYQDISEYLAKMDYYTNLAAAKSFEQGTRFHFWRHALLPWDFFCRAILKLGLLDGQAGLVYAGLSSFYHWLKYVKLAELENSRKPS